MDIENEDCLLTIAIPTYNRKNLLKRALDSIVPQLDPKIEVLVSDNASDDGTDAMIARAFPEVRYIKNAKNMGWDYNFLQCYREAKGKYVILLGSDDRLEDGAVGYLIDFLEKNECDLTFLNFRYFDNEVEVEVGGWIKDYQEKSNIVTTDKGIFMKYAGHSITFVSATVFRRTLFGGVKEPERFIGTSFMHAYIMFEAIKGLNATFGVIMRPLIKANATAGESEMSRHPEMAFTIFGKYLYSLLCIHAVECGFQKQQMRRIYLNYLHDNPLWKCILTYRHCNNKTGMDVFWKDGYPVVKQFPLVWLKAMVAAFMPKCILNALYRAKKCLK